MLRSASDGRQARVMERSDKRQRQEFNKLQQRLREVQLEQKEIENTQREVIFAMGTIAESRSQKTGHHVKRGEHFDPELIDLFFEHFPQLDEIRMDLRD